ncbi:tetratricopeptide repeat protein [Alicyclobacillus fastidiosus]|uniref:tetratricopeptide repeat protein n=1 Tax=Alicyclobacillus fastidiosus TaxID=392011 RepID=UPI0023E94D6E|nr:tetratricopeptide repeat protein [Alicyclobacillus fastidiosus]GMA66054.1 hypothetical protein GCM10025859_64960 [Alicyclobacillus fastidiosus]
MGKVTHSRIKYGTELKCRKSKPQYSDTLLGKDKLEPLVQAESWYYLGYAAFFQERIELTQSACERCLRLCEEHHLFKLWAMVYGLQGTVLRRTAQYEQAIESLERAYNMMDKVEGTEEDKFRVRLSIGDNLELLGRLDESEEV